MDSLYTVQRFLILLITLFFLLTSCSYKSVKKDGAPNYYVDETTIPNAIPKKEPLAKYGNMKKYFVFGKPYFVMPSSKCYDEVGIASWYGTKFHARKTSSGEPYDLLAMTAAHKHLPLPTYVEVTNLGNHKKIIVKVNDRGPFAENRIIDLSYVAAKKLGMLGRGTAKVRVRTITPYGLYSPEYCAKSEAEKPVRVCQNKVKAPGNMQFVYLQVGAFQNKINAEKLKNQLSAILPTPVRISTPSFKQRYYRVQVGPIKDVAAVDRISRRLQGLGISTKR